MGGPALRSLLVVALALSLSLAATAPVAGAGHDAESRLQVTLAADGSADVTLHLAYDLRDENRRAAFQSLRDDVTAQRERARTYGDRMERVAAAITNETGRTASASDATIDVAATGDVGTITLSVTITGFAATTDDGVRVRSPFAGGFVTDRPLVLVGPEGYVATDVDPAPDASDDRRLRWAAERDLTGFTATFSSAEGTTVTDGTAPGFGPVSAVAALVAALAVARAVRRRD